MWQTHTHTHKTSSPLWLRQAGNCQRKDEIFWLVTLSRLFLSVLPKMPTFVALWGTDRMPACDWETMGYMHTLKTSEKLCKAHEDQCFLNRDPDGWVESPSQFREATYIPPPSWESLCVIKGHSLWRWGAYAKDVKTKESDWECDQDESPFASFTDASGPQMLHDGLFLLHRESLQTSFYTPRLPHYRVFFCICPLFNVTQSLLMNFKTNLFYYVKRKKMWTVKNN